MPPALAEVHSLLWADVSALFQRWTTFGALYCDREAVDVLNWTAGGFFALLQRVLLDDIYLGIARLADPPSTGRHSNLVLASLLPHVPSEGDLGAECERLIHLYDSQATFARAMRHKLLAHRDHSVATGNSDAVDFFVSPEQIRLALAAAADVLNYLDRTLEQRTTVFSEFVHLKGAETLLARLPRARELDAEFYRRKLDSSDGGARAV